MLRMNLPMLFKSRTPNPSGCDSELAPSVVRVESGRPKFVDVRQRVPSLRFTSNPRFPAAIPTNRRTQLVAGSGRELFFC